jgi:hypothetical protein
LKAIATVILIDIMRVLSNHYSTVNQRAIAMVNQWLPLQTIATVNQWLHWKPLQWLFTFFWLYITLKNSFRNGSNRDCNGPLQNNNRRCNGDSH